MIFYANGQVYEGHVNIARIILDPTNGKRTLHMIDAKGDLTINNTRYGSAVVDVTHVWNDHSALERIVREQTVKE